MDDSEEEQRLHPLHRHHLQRKDPHEIYPQYGGAWKCDHCLRTSVLIGQSFPWHCISGCEFDLCHECVAGREHPLHRHPLVPVDANQVYAPEHGIWTCENCNRARLTTKERFPYHCATCKFDLCSRCANGILLPLHEHRLLPADADIVYPQHNGLWYCDRCKASRKTLEEKKMWHCSMCNFDICKTCAGGVRHPRHIHPLYNADADVCYRSFNGQWVCDACQTPRRVNDQRYMRHCEDCSFDLCLTCFKQLGNFRPVASSSRSRVNADSEHQRVTTVPVAESDSAAKAAGKPAMKPPVAAARNDGDGELCILCMDKPRNATFVHGNSGHLACCLECAKKLHRRGQPCPICRQQIYLVIEQFVV